MSTNFNKHTLETIINTFGFPVYIMGYEGFNYDILIVEEFNGMYIGVYDDDDVLGKLRKDAVVDDYQVLGPPFESSSVLAANTCLCVTLLNGHMPECFLWKP